MRLQETPDPNTGHATYRQRMRWGFGVFAVIAFFFLWQEHRAHLLGALPWLLLLACPFVHFFMHGGHHSHGDLSKASQDTKPGSKLGEDAHVSHGRH